MKYNKQHVWQYCEHFSATYITILTRIQVIYVAGGGIDLFVSGAFPQKRLDFENSYYTLREIILLISNKYTFCDQTEPLKTAHITIK